MSIADGHDTVAFLVLVHRGQNDTEIIRPAYRRYIDAQEEAAAILRTAVMPITNTLSVEIMRIGVKP